MFCTNCGKEIPEGSRFCSFCGTDQQSDLTEAKSSSSAVVTREPTKMCEISFELRGRRPLSIGTGKLHVFIDDIEYTVATKKLNTFSARVLPGTHYIRVSFFKDLKGKLDKAGQTTMDLAEQGVLGVDSLFGFAIGLGTKASSLVSQMQDCDIIVCLENGVNTKISVSFGFADKIKLEEVR